LLLVALCTLALPVAGWLYVRQMETLLREGQARPCSPRHGQWRASLVVTGAVLPEDGNGWYVQQATSPITMDGYGDDWAPLTPWSQSLGSSPNSAASCCWPKTAIGFTCTPICDTRARAPMPTMRMHWQPII
jgi:two-component system sensor histidine kinase ChvG